MSAQLERELLSGLIVLSVLLSAGLGAYLLRSMLKMRSELVQYFFAVDVLVLTLSVITSGRIITGDESILAPQSAAVRQSVIVSQLLTIAVMVIACERVLRFLMHREMKMMRTLPMLGGLLLFFVVINFITPLLGLYSEFQHNFLYAPIMALALYAVAQKDGFESLLRVVRNAYLLFLAGGLLFLVVSPAMVADFSYDGGLIPGLKIRFYGFSTHPNSLAPYCLMLLCCLWVVPFKRLGMNRAAWGVGLLTLLLTQSKTTIGLGLAMFALMWWQSRRDQMRLVAPTRMGQVSGSMAMAFAGVVAVGAVVGLAALLGGAVDVDGIEAALTSPQVLTLTGRTRIWEISLDALWENPLFGYGADLWGPAYQQHVNLFVSHAHNQYVHTLGDSGFVGLVALVAYLVMLGVYSWRVRRETRWLSVALASYIFLRGITEAPLVVDSMFGADIAAHMMLLVLCVGGMRDSVRGLGWVGRGEPVAAVRPVRVSAGADRAGAGA